VIVYEEKLDVGHRFHGDFQGLENWSSVEDVTRMLDKLGIYNKLSRDSIFQPCNELIVFDANLKKTVLRSKRPFFYLVQRGDNPDCLDRGLLEVAKEAGVRVVFGKKVDKFEEGGIVSIGPRAADIIAKGVVFKTTMEDTAAAILDDRLAPKGYAYLLVHKGRATMATCMFREFKREKECFERTVEAFRKVFPALDMPGGMVDEREFGGYGNFFFGKPVYENGRYYTGEAAGLQDCLFGFGMRYAMLSGYLAALSITGKGDYGALLKKELLPMQRVSLVNRFFYERFGNEGYKNFIGSFAKGDVMEKLRGLYNPSFLKTLVYPIASRRYKSRLVDKGCHGEGCACVWCRCRKEVC
jgi:flavin-dependent dehydrogenase